MKDPGEHLAAAELAIDTLEELGDTAALARTHALLAIEARLSAIDDSLMVIRGEAEMDLAGLITIGIREGLFGDGAESSDRALFGDFKWEGQPAEGLHRLFECLMSSISDMASRLER